MRVCLDLTPSIQGHAGLGRLAFETARALVALDAGIEFSFFITDSQGRIPPPPLDTLPRRALKLANKPWRMLVMASHLTGVQLDHLLPPADVFHATDHLLPPLRIPGVITLADLTFLSHTTTHLPLNRWFLTLMMPHFLRQARAAITISENTRRDADRIYHIHSHKFRVIYPGVDVRFTPQPADQIRAICDRYMLPERFILYVGTIEPRKNLPTLFEAFKQACLPDVKLIIAGKQGWLYDETFARLRALGLEQDVIFTGFVPDDDLPALYAQAEAFVLPSLYEGFGLPVLEAMACGTPVVCSNTSSLPEVAGDAALLVSPTDVRGWAQALEQIMHNAALRADLRQRGLRRAGRFTWEDTARQTREVYRELYAHHP